MRAHPAWRAHGHRVRCLSAARDAVASACLSDEPMLLGVVADDLTGATDVALMLQRAGMSVVQAIGVPASAGALPEADAVVVSLKSRTCPPAEAVAQSIASTRALRARGAKQI